MSFKTKIVQGDLRKAMNEAKKKISAVKKIESPLAKYSDAGQLTCVLCKTIVRSEAVWPVHLNSKNHKENIELAKKSLMAKESKPIMGPPMKRPMSPPCDGLSASKKKVKGILKHSEPAKSSLPEDFFDDSPKNHNSAASRISEKCEIPRAETIKRVQESKDEGNPAALPEGFFDDPKMDAKVRNVDYKDPIEEEWDKFQKEIKEETAQSAQIIAEDQEEATTERQIDEIEEQIRHWSRVMDLVKRKEQVQTVEKKKEGVGEGESSDEEENYDEFLDWRAKNSYQ